MVNIYILELEDGKYYVGKTNHTFDRFSSHWQGHGAKWTKKHKPVDLYAFHRDRPDSDENKLTLAMMRHYGVANVRGGSWVKVDMTDYEISRLESKLHYRRFSNPKEPCGRCGRQSHDISTCYAKSHIDGRPLDKREITVDDFAPFIESYREERTQAILIDDNPDDERQMQELLLEIDALLAMSEENPEQMVEVMEQFSEDDNAPPYHDLLSGIIYTFGNVMEDVASRVLESAVDRTTKSVEKSAKRIERSGKRFIERNRKKFGL